MRIAGIIAEYNPFHNGHAYHIARTREATHCDFVVAAMSGAFTQRGEPALLDKWVRAQMALAAGVDLVVELPALFAVRPAEHFATGGVTLLSALGVTTLSFGCECDDLAMLTRAAALLNDESTALTSRIRARLELGQSHARARGEALSELMGVPAEALGAPNTALGIAYLRANARLERPMDIAVVKRNGGYHDLALGPVASASAIRATVYAGALDDARVAMPDAAFARLSDCAQSGQMSRAGALDDLALYRLRAMTAEQLARLPDVAEGLERRLKDAAEHAASRAALLDRAKCKRYTHARLSRVVTYALMGLDRALAERVPATPYARILGFRDGARPLLREIGERATLPFTPDAARLKAHPAFALERRATDLWGLTTEDAAMRVAARDLTMRPVMG